MKYIALLRGINVGGNNKISMRELKTCFENAGLQNVITYINSGNILFDCDELDTLAIAMKCEKAIEQQFKLAIRLALIDAYTLKDAMEHTPVWWGSDQSSNHNVLFVIAPATVDEVLSDIGEIRPEYEKISYHSSLIFWSVQIQGISRARWSKIVGTNAYKNVTVRNANTAIRLLELAFS